MTAERVFTVARKEFADQVTGWRFLVILALFLGIALAGTYSGVGSYERDLDRYAQELATMDDRFDEPGRMVMPSKPPVEGVYSSMFLVLISYGGLLAIAVGFDLVSGEKESRSLKSLLSHPVYRDEIINGKALGGVALLVLVVGGVLLISTALLLVFSIVPSPDDLWMILTYAGVTLLSPCDVLLHRACPLHPLPGERQRTAPRGGRLHPPLVRDPLHHHAYRHGTHDGGSPTAPHTEEIPHRKATRRRSRHTTGSGIWSRVPPTSSPRGWRSTT